MFKAVIDVRRVRDFGIGTYIRNLVHALAEQDKVNRYFLTGAVEDKKSLEGLPGNFQFAAYTRRDDDPWDNVSFPMFLRRFHADFVHIPLNRVPLAMPRPYVVTIHDMASLLFDKPSGLRMNLRRYRFSRGLRRAERVIAVSEATRRDLHKVLGIGA